MVLDAQFKELKVADLKTYLKMNGMSDVGKKEALIDRVLECMEKKNSI